jgi:hypothetical protein
MLEIKDKNIWIKRIMKEIITMVIKYIEMIKNYVRTRRRLIELLY